MLAKGKNLEIVRLDNVNFSYPESSVFYDLNLSFFEGGFYFLTGASGVGKTSLLKLIYCNLIPNSGSINVFGYDTKFLNRKNIALLRQRMGLVFQDCRLIEHLNVLDNVALGMKVTDAETGRCRSYAKELLHWVGLENHLYHLPQKLSDGQKQRVAIARAVITRPLLLLADEPTGNVDDKIAYKLMVLFEELNKVGTTVVMATHNRGIISSFPYPEFELYQGRIKRNHASSVYPDYKTQW